jgi:hypothetical protein
MKELVSRIFQADFLKGMSVTFRTQSSENIYTQDFEMAHYRREGAIWDRHWLEEGPTPTRYTR